ncbi:hypothetical protein HYH03_008417 [Edaphochlamys debaryana]|uniref:Uncharacterized protein n=1 Tax=Edaphochlamys debaryana TaxID=47281 RepID=A0A835Y6B4_9CHLO|nr:hypothetical protein HYH03_008417 [Edaphochlamys debaryana]|eukprot:KAG2493280.1 hypothetical protein HYH03_008417 [Edaphochlamys debaryana]
MEGQAQPKAEPSAPQGDPHFAHLPNFAQELQELGLLEFAQEVDFARLTDTPGAPVLAPASARHPGGAGPVGHNNPPPQPTAAIDIQQCQLANHTADLATARATQVLHLAKVGLHQIVTSYNPRAAGSGGTDGSSKRRKTSRGADASGSRSGSKGLRHFSMKVCEKVEAKGRTTYNEVADELVAEMSKIEAASKNGQYDEKNIRRRVYDAINVLMAMDIIQKEKKEILWRGFPKLSHNSLDRVKVDRTTKIKEVEQKQLYLQDMIEQQKALKKLLERSAQRGANPGGTQLFLPFILVQAKPDATVEVKISDDMMDVQFDFYHSPFQIHDDSHVLKKMAEHQHRQLPNPQQPQQQAQAAPPQQQAIGNPLAAAAGLGLPWPAQNGSAPGNLATGNLIAAATAAAAALQPIADPALATLALAQAQAQGNSLAYGYQGAAAALYQQQQQQGQGQGQGLQQQHSGPQGQHQGQGSGGQGPAGQHQGQAAGQHQALAGPQGGPHQAQGQLPHLQQQQLQQLQALALQQQQLHSQLLQQRASMGGGLPLPPLQGGGASGLMPAQGAGPFSLPPASQLNSGLSQQQHQGGSGSQQLPSMPQIPANLAAALGQAQGLGASQQGPPASNGGGGGAAQSQGMGMSGPSLQQLSAPPAAPAFPLVA